jgi:hypothetical protein
MTWGTSDVWWLWQCGEYRASKMVELRRLLKFDGTQAQASRMAKRRGSGYVRFAKLFCSIFAAVSNLAKSRFARSDRQSGSECRKETGAVSRLRIRKYTSDCVSHLVKGTIHTTRTCSLRNLAIFFVSGRRRRNKATIPTRPLSR